MSQKKNIIPVAKVEPIIIDYNGSKVNAKKLTVRSEIPIGIDIAWNNLKTPALLQFVAKGMIKFKSAAGDFPKQWEVGKTYGVYPFGQVHLAQSIRKLIDSQAGFLNLPLGRVQPEGSNCKAADLRFACVGNSPVAAEHL